MMIPTNANVRRITTIQLAQRLWSGSRRAEARTIQDAAIEYFDRECVPRWQIAAITGLSLSQVYRRLAVIRANRAAARRHAEDG